MPIARTETWPEVPDVRDVPEIGALREWWDELAAGARTVRTSDGLRRGAILEARARDALKLGQRAAANRDRLETAAVILEAATSEAA